MNAISDSFEFLLVIIDLLHHHVNRFLLLLHLLLGMLLEIAQHF
jgi:hypothetical protein